MDVSQFLKSFKRNVAAKARGTSAAGATVASAEAKEAEELSDLMHSDSDHEADTLHTDYVASGSRADKLTGKRYGAHHKRNQEFDTLKVFSTNANRTSEPGRLQRQRVVAARQLNDTRKRPQAELVASVRAELLRQREQLQATRDVAAAEVVAAPVAKMEATMVQVEDLLSQSNTAAPPTEALLSFLPPPVPSTSPVPSVSATLSGPPAKEAPSVTVAPASITDVPPVEAAGAAPPAKKRSKFEMALSMAKADEDE